MPATRAITYLLIDAIYSFLFFSFSVSPHSDSNSHRFVGCACVCSCVWVRVWTLMIRAAPICIHRKETLERIRRSAICVCLHCRTTNSIKSQTHIDDKLICIERRHQHKHNIPMNFVLFLYLKCSSQNTVWQRPRNRREKNENKK